MKLTADHNRVLNGILEKQGRDRLILYEELHRLTHRQGSTTPSALRQFGQRLLKQDLDSAQMALLAQAMQLEASVLLALFSNQPVSSESDAPAILMRLIPQAIRTHVDSLPLAHLGKQTQHLAQFAKDRVYENHTPPIQATMRHALTQGTLSEAEKQNLRASKLTVHATSSMLGVIALFKSLIHDLELKYWSIECSYTNSLEIHDYAQKTDADGDRTHLWILGDIQAKQAFSEHKLKFLTLIGVNQMALALPASWGDCQSLTALPPKTRVCFLNHRSATAKSDFELWIKKLGKDLIPESLHPQDALARLCQKEPSAAVLLYPFQKLIATHLGIATIPLQLNASPTTWRWFLFGARSNKTNTLHELVTGALIHAQRRMLHEHNRVEQVAEWITEGDAGAEYLANLASVSGLATYLEALRFGI
ncbi:MAG: hypothetical protein JNJ83_13995 [Verrucomicrobiaceae bacterium]|nr:hypothetical protein [Verrucomicrobiaceae bacterium]